MGCLRTGKIISEGLNKTYSAATCHLCMHETDRMTVTAHRKRKPCIKKANVHRLIIKPN